ncbi:MAG: ethylbenzene dehydrogenase-related protein [Candidatus Scalindua sediminis]
MYTMRNNTILKGSLICLFAGIVLILCLRVGFAQTTQIFRTYKTGVTARIPQTSEAIVAGKKIYEKRCYYCHGIKGDGNGPAAPRLDPKPRNFTRNEYKIRSTELGTLPTDEDLFRIITSGVEGTAMPFWSTLSSEERWQVIYYVKTFYEGFKESEAHEVVPISGEIPSDSESVKRGKELFKEAKCLLCHGEDGRADGQITTTLKGKWNFPYKARNLTKSWLFKGGNTTKDIYRTVTTGINETPMGSYADFLTDKDRWHLTHYVKTLSHDMNTEVVLKSKLVEGDLPEGPDGAAWDTVSSIEMPLAGQIVARPRLWIPSVNSIRIKSMYNKEDIVFLLEWDDKTNEQDEAYSDAVALQFPTKIPEGMKKPYFAMGESGKSVIIWHWRAYDEFKQTEKNENGGDTEAATDGGSSVAEHEKAEKQEEVSETGAVQEEKIAEEKPKEKFRGFATIKEMNAKGFKNLAEQPSNSQHSKSKGYWKNGKWKVMITRPLMTDDKKIDIQFETGKLIPYALAAWDGSNSEIGGQKSISSWYYLVLEVNTPISVYLYVLIAIIMGVSIQFWVIGRIRRFPPKITTEE